MRTSENRLVFGTIALFVSIVAIGFVYAGFTGTLNINGTGSVTASKWDIYFANLSNAVTTGHANVIEAATIKTKTSIGDYLVEFDELGDSLTYTFDVVNGGNFDAVLTTLTIVPPQCSGGDATSNQVACNNLEYTLKYTSNNTVVAANDKLLAGETKNMTLKLQVKNNGNLTGLTRDVTIGGLGITMLYTQDSAFGGNSNNGGGSTPSTPTYLYTTTTQHLGDTLIVNNTTVFDNFESAKYNGNNFTTAHIVDNSNHIIESYVAFKINDTIYYLKGYDTTAYEDNQEVLIEAFGRSACSGLTVMNYTIKDTLLNILGIEKVYADRPLPPDPYGSTSCSGGGLNADAYSGGNVGVYSSNENCHVDPYGAGSGCW